MRVIKKSEVRKIIIGHVELTLIFLFDYLLCKIAILESLKVLFLDKKQKLLSVDGNMKTEFKRPPSYCVEPITMGGGRNTVLCQQTLR